MMKTKIINTAIIAFLTVSTVVSVETANAQRRKGQTSEPAAVPEPSNTITFVLLGILGNRFSYKTIDKITFIATVQQLRLIIC